MKKKVGQASKWMPLIVKVNLINERDLCAIENRILALLNKI
jgi:hypothetical protein